MSKISEALPSVRKIPSTQTKPIALKAEESEEDLQLVAERLSLILGHISQMPQGCISGVTIRDGFLLVAFKVKGHELTHGNGITKLNGRDVTTY